MGSLGVQELLIILVIVVVLFGGSKIAAIGKGLGEGIKNFKNAIKDGGSDKNDSVGTQKQ